MLRQIIKKSIKNLLAKPKLIRWSFFFSFGSTVANIYFYVYFFNTVINHRYHSWVEVSSALLYLYNKIQEFDIAGMIVLFVIIVILGKMVLFPIGEGVMITGIQSENDKMLPVLSKGIKYWKVMAEYSAMTMLAFSCYTFVTCIVRLQIMEILDYPLMKFMVIVWWIVILFSILFWPYAKYCMINENLSVFDALKRSITLTVNNFWLTIKALFFEIILWFRFVLNAAVVVAVPFFWMYIASYFKILDNPSVEIWIWIATGVVLLFVAYINTLIDLFFANYRLNIYKKALQNLDE